MLSKQLQKQIEQESNDRAEGWQDKMKSQIAKTEYELGAEKYATLYETALARAERAERALREIYNLSIIIGSPRGAEIHRIANKALTPKTGEDE